MRAILIKKEYNFLGGQNVLATLITKVYTSKIMLSTVSTCVIFLAYSSPAKREIVWEHKGNQVPTAVRLPSSNSLSALSVFNNLDL